MCEPNDSVEIEGQMLGITQRSPVSFRAIQILISTSDDENSRDAVPESILGQLPFKPQKEKRKNDECCGVTNGQCAQLAGVYPSALRDIVAQLGKQQRCQNTREDVCPQSVRVTRVNMVEMTGGF